MKLALLGITQEALNFAREAISAGHALRDVFDPSPQGIELVAELANGQVRTDWENLLHEQEFDAVVIAGPLLEDAINSEWRTRREDQLRKLVQARVPLITLPPVCEAILGLELEMIRRDMKGVIASFYPQAEHEVWLELANQAEQFEQITVEHALAVRARSAVQAAFVHDLEILRRFLGPLRRIAASGADLRENERPDLSHVSVSVIGTNLCTVRWSVVPAREQPETRFLFHGAASTITIIAPDRNRANSDWRLIVDEEVTLPRLNAVDAFLQSFQQAVREEKNHATPWLDSCRNVEAMEAIDRSLERSRTINLYNEDVSEASSFKGTMAVWGCLLLMITFFVFIGMGILPLLLGPKQAGGNSWWMLQTCLIVPFVIFLVLQLLSFGLQAHQRRKHAQPAESKLDAESK